MKRITLLGCILWAALLAGNSFAQEANLMNTHKGNWALDGDLTFQLITRSYSKSDDTQFTLSTAAQYFFADRFSMGLNATVFAATDYETATLLGPVMTYHFYEQDKVSLYTQGAFLFGLPSDSNEDVLGLRVGMEYFFTPSVAFGPSLFWNHYMYDSGRSINAYGMALKFGIFL